MNEATFTPLVPLNFWTLLIMLPDDIRGDQSSESDWVEFIYLTSDDGTKPRDVFRDYVETLFGEGRDPDDFVIIAILPGIHKRGDIE